MSSLDIPPSIQKIISESYTRAYEMYIDWVLLMSEMGYGSIEEILNWPLTRFTHVQNKLDKKLKKNRK